MSSLVRMHLFVDRLDVVPAKPKAKPATRHETGGNARATTRVCGDSHSFASC
jgi:hypothetical protein